MNNTGKIISFVVALGATTLTGGIQTGVIPASGRGHNFAEWGLVMCVWLAASLPGLFGKSGGGGSSGGGLPLPPLGAVSIPADHGLLKRLCIPVIVLTLATGCAVSNREARTLAVECGLPAIGGAAVNAAEQLATDLAATLEGRPAFATNEWETIGIHLAERYSWQLISCVAAHLVTDWQKGALAGPPVARRRCHLVHEEHLPLLRYLARHRR